MTCSASLQHWALLTPSIRSYSSVAASKQNENREKLKWFGELKWGLDKWEQTDSKWPSACWGGVRGREGHIWMKRWCIICLKNMRWKTKKRFGKLASNIRAVYQALSWHHYHQRGGALVYFSHEFSRWARPGHKEWNSEHHHQPNRKEQVTDDKKL